MAYFQLIKAWGPVQARRDILTTNPQDGTICLFIGSPPTAGQAFPDQHFLKYDDHQTSAEYVLNNRSCGEIHTTVFR
jgi:hypothetical protein